MASGRSGVAGGRLSWLIWSNMVTSFAFTKMSVRHQGLLEERRDHPGLGTLAHLSWPADIPSGQAKVVLLLQGFEELDGGELG